VPVTMYQMTNGKLWDASGDTG